MMPPDADIITEDERDDLDLAHHLYSVACMDNDVGERYRVDCLDEMVPQRAQHDIQRMYFVGMTL